MRQTKFSPFVEIRASPDLMALPLFRIREAIRSPLLTLASSIKSWIDAGATGTIIVEAKELEGLADLMKAHPSWRVDGQPAFRSRALTWEEGAALVEAIGESPEAFPVHG